MCIKAYWVYIYYTLYIDCISQMDDSLFCFFLVCYPLCCSKTHISLLWDESRIILFYLINTSPYPQLLTQTYLCFSSNIVSTSAVGTAGDELSKD